MPRQIDPDGPDRPLPPRTGGRHWVVSRRSSVGAKTVFVAQVSSVLAESAVLRSAARYHGEDQSKLRAQFRNGSPWPGAMVFLLRLPNGRQEFWFAQ